MLSFVDALIYMFSSITKKGEIESATNPRVVLLIHNNIWLIELISIEVDYFRKFNDWKWYGLEMWTPQNAKEKYWQKLKTLRFYLSDPRSH